MIEAFASRVAAVLPDPARRALGDVWLRAKRARTADASALGELAVARELFARLGIETGFAVDVAACDGVTKSNTLGLYEAGWRGLAVEGNPERFARLARAYVELGQVALVRTWITPASICAILEAGGVPEQPEFLNLDLDSYDHFVLDALLERHRPKLVCAEINEKIPPPIRFTVTYDPGHVWQLDHFYGQSISKLYELCERHGYALVRLHYNNAFLAPVECGLPGVTPEVAYRAGYLERPDRLEVFPWNADMEQLHALGPDDQLAFLRAKFAAYEGRYELDV